MFKNSLNNLSSLRAKMLAALAIGGILLLAIAVFFLRNTMLDGYAKLEKEKNNIELNAAIGLIKFQTNEVYTNAIDYAHWDDMYQFAFDKNVQFVQSNLIDSVFLNSKLNAIIAVNNDNQIIYQRGVDFTTGKSWKIPAEIIQQTGKNGLLTNPDKSHIVGLFSTEQGVCIIAAVDILDSSETKPRRGTLMMIRLLDSAILQKIGTTLGTTVSVSSLDKTEISTLSTKLLAGEKIANPINSTTISNYSLLDSIDETKLVLKTVGERKIYKQSQSTLNILYWLSALAVVLLAIFSYIFDNLVLKKLQKLNNDVNIIGQSASFETRLAEREVKDEFNTLAHGINGMLDQLDLAKQELLFEKERAQVTLSSIAEAVITSDTTGRILFVNAATEKLTGLAAQEIVGKSLQEIFHLKTADKTTTVNSLWLTNPHSVVDEVLLTDRYGLEFILSKSASPLHDSKGGLFGIVTVLHDVTALRVMSNKLSQQARYDALTGLPNRYEFDRKAQLAIEDAQNSAHTHCIAFIDLDKFKLVNDTCGHLAGDIFLKQLSQHMQEKLRTTDTLARLGGDEFALLLIGCNLSKAHDILNDMIKTIEGFRFNYDNKMFKVGASIGLAEISPKQKLSLNELLAIADSACYSAKNQGGNCVYEYNADENKMQEQSNLLSWVARINLGIEKNQFVLFCQPMKSIKPNAEAHCEVLIRMKGDDGMLFPPSTFLPAAERYRLMPQIDRWVVNEALSIIARKGKKFNTLCAINLSGQSLSQEGFLEYVEEKIRQLKVNPKRICFEITETAVISNLEKAQHFMRNLRALGCRFSLDDFGSGLSSFAYLKNLEVDFLKIDGMFIKNIVNNKIDRAMVESINNIGHVMGLHTIGEFAENQEVIDILEEIGLDYAQGYGVALPVLFE